jgi:hypothetical protein
MHASAAKRSLSGSSSSQVPVAPGASTVAATGRSFHPRWATPRAQQHPHDALRFGRRKTPAPQPQGLRGRHQAWMQADEVCAASIHRAAATAGSRVSPANVPQQRPMRLVTLMAIDPPPASPGSIGSRGLAAAAGHWAQPDTRAAPCRSVRLSRTCRGGPSIHAVEPRKREHIVLASRARTRVCGATPSWLGSNRGIAVSWSSAPPPPRDSAGSGSGSTGAGYLDADHTQLTQPHCRARVARATGHTGIWLYHVECDRDRSPVAHAPSRARTRVCRLPLWE